MDLLTGFAFGGYRSFASDHVAVLAPLSKINLISGQNNAGKSNILRVIHDTFNAQKSEFKHWDRPVGESKHQFQRYVLKNTRTTLDLATGLRNNRSLYEEAARLLSDQALFPWAEPSTEAFWIGIGHAGRLDNALIAEAADRISPARQGGALSSALTNTGGGGRGADEGRILQNLGALTTIGLNSYSISGVREITESDDGDFDFNGRSIKKRLQQLQSPSSLNLSDKRIFEKVQRFVQAVLDDDQISIDIPHDLTTIHVTQGGKTLPIESMGTGVHEVVILAAAASIIENSILCVEEPEVHLHPILQRKLLRFLASSTSNQYFIATHSAHMLDSAIGSIFHVTRDGEWSSVRFVGSAADQSAVCTDLGYRPSDIVQTNAVLWVEGPSDRIYLKSWIERVAPGKFVEGIHYSIMFYGGSLLSSLSPLDLDAVEDFISLRRLNRYMAVIIDSDKKSAGSTLNANKRRVIDELKRDPITGIAWVTAGYTIENYVPEPSLTQGLRKAHPSLRSKELQASARYENPLAEDRLGIRASKVSVARAAIAAWNDDVWPMDLKRRAQDVVALIERANAHL